MSDPTEQEVPDAAPVDPTDSADSTPAPAPDAGASDTPDATTSSADGDTPIFDSIGGDTTVVDTPTDQVEVTPVEAGDAVDSTESTSDSSETPSTDGDLGPTNTGIADGKDGASPTENQPVLGQDGLDQPGPGVEPSVSLSPDPSTDTGTTSGDTSAPDVAPVLEEEPVVDTIAAPAVPEQAVARTPQFHGRKHLGYVSVGRIGYIGSDALEVEIEEIDELIGLLEELRDAEILTE